MILFSMIIGAGIGGLTNSIAIYMLFRPYSEIKIGGWSLPFTPGLIPKRQAEMAKQLGELVEKHLFTVESIQSKLLLPSFQEEVQEWVKLEVSQWLETDQTCNDLLQVMGLYSEDEVPGENIESYIVKQIENKLRGWWLENKERRLQDVIPLEEIDFEGRIQRGTDALLNKARDFLYSEEGEHLLYESIQTGVERQGTLGSMLGIFITKDKVLDKVRPALIYWLEQDKTNETVRKQVTLFSREFLDQKIEVLFQEEAKEKSIQYILNKFKEKANFQHWFNTPINQLAKPWKEEILSYSPKVVSKLGEWMYDQSPLLFKKIGISEMVRKQVMQFPLARLERMVRELAHQELRMITLLGAVLGGLIGVLQAIIILYLLV
jgi:uncharacterized membrane protein YheB (UPF0754 family)